MKLSVDILQVEQVTQSYVEWYSNEEVVRYSDNQYRRFSFDGQCSYVEGCLKNDDIDLYGIFDDTIHIGNISISGLNSHHQNAEIAYVIGETNYWGRGVASFAVASMIHKAREEYDLNKLHACTAGGNIRSGKVLEKNGFIIEGIRKKHVFLNGEFVDQIDYGLLLKC